MGDSDRYSFARLGNKNYANDWDLRMEAILVRKGLWGVVQVVVSDTNSDGTEKTVEEMDMELRTLIATRDAAKMAEARAELVLRVEPGQLAHMTSRDPMIIWQDLQRVHRAAGFATSLALRRQFLTAKKLDSETMEDWIGRVQSMVLRMEYTGIVVTDQDKILAFTMGLPATYEAVVINFDATSPNALTVEHVISRLLNEETRQQSNTAVDIPSPANPDHDPNNVAFAARRISALSQTCYFCDKKGHFKSDCPERLRWEESKKKSTDTAAIAECDSDEYDGVW
jgi:hypothetical protein